jgi:enoyl-CoA hydratase
VTPLLYELHDLARERGIEGYRRMSKGDLAALLEVEMDADAERWPAAPAGPTEVDVTVRQRFGLVTLRGTDNALSLETLERLAGVVEELADDESVRLVAITGAGTRLFSSGADLASVSGLGGLEVTSRGTDACSRIAAAGVPTLALLNGHAVGGAIDLALACDWRVAVQGAKLRFIHNEFVDSPPWGGAARLAALLGRSEALRLFATCELLPVEEAQKIGLVEEVVGPSRLLSRAESLATRIARADRDAVIATKRLLHEELDLSAHERSFAALWDARAGQARIPA